MRLIYTKPKLKDLSQDSRIAFARQFRYMTQDNVTDKLGLTGECKRRTMTRYEKGDYIRINSDNLINVGYTRPWATRIVGIKRKGESSFTDFRGFACIGLEYASSGSDRAWY